MAGGKDLAALERAAWRGFLRSHARLVRELDAELQAEIGLPLSSFDVLIQLANAPESRLRMSGLAEAVLLSASGLTRLVDRLEKEGLVERQRCDSDRRGSFAVLTEAGRRRLREARGPHLDGVRRRYLSRFSDQELAKLAEFWDRLEPAPSPA